MIVIDDRSGVRVRAETKESALLLPTRPNNHSATFNWNPRYMKNLKLTQLEQLYITGSIS